jgi:trk system potassium uptake protein
MNFKKIIKLNPSQLLILVFVISITVGTILLKLPFSTHESIKWIDALFIATSAMTVTGLATVDPGSTFTVVGQLIIALLIQVGGLGIMSFAILIFIMLGKKIGIKERLVMQYALNLGGVVRLVIYLFIITMVSILFVIIVIVILNLTEKAPFIDLMFEVVSAFGTVGLSTGITGTLTLTGKQIIIFIMFLGKLGPLTLMFSLATPSKEKIRYPQEDILTG